MKTINRITILLSVSLLFLLVNCKSADEEFVHESNIITEINCKVKHDGTSFTGEIYEYNANKELITGPFTQKDIEGGYGLILFSVSKSLQKHFDLSSVYLVANVGYDAFITPTLSGKHDITGDGIIVSVKSGVGTLRHYRVRGYYE